MTLTSPWVPDLWRDVPALRAKPAWLGEPKEVSTTTTAIVAIAGIAAVGYATSMGIVVALATLLMLAASFVVLRYPVLGGYALVALVPITSGLRRGFPVPGLRISELLVGALALLILVPALRRDTPKWTLIDWAGCTYATLAFVLPVSHLIARNGALTMSAVASTFLSLQFFLLYRTVRTALANREQRELATRMLLLSSLVVAALAVVQQLNVGPARSVMLQITGSDALDSYGYSVYARATGPFQHWHPLAGYLTVILLLTIALLLDKAQTILSTRWLLIVLAAAASALMLSVTFVALFGVTVGAALLGARAKKLRQALIWIVGGGIAGMALFGSFILTRLQNQYDNGVGGRRTSWVPQTLQYRIDVWRDQYLPGMGGRWLSGYGPDLPPDAAWTHTESVYITLALRGGVPLLAAFALSMLAVHWTSKRLESDPARRPLARTLITLVAVLWIMQLLFPYFTSSGMPQPFWVLVAITTAGWKMNQLDTAESPQAT